MKARVTVTLKTGVLDPQGQAIQGALKALGFAGLASVRQGKVFDIELANLDPAVAETNLKAMADKLLANKVIENFSIEIAGTRPASGVEPAAVAAVAAALDAPPPLPEVPGTSDVPEGAPAPRPVPPPDDAI